MLEEGEGNDRDQQLLIVSDLTLQECADKCTEGRETEALIECGSFEYDSDQKICTILAEQSQPFGNGALLNMGDRSIGTFGWDQQKHHNHIQQFRQNLAHFQPICLPIGHLKC